MIAYIQKRYGIDIYVYKYIHQGVFVKSLMWSIFSLMYLTFFPL